MTGVVFTFLSADNAIATVDNAGTVRGVAQGNTVVTVSGTANGRAATMDVPVTVGSVGTPGPPASVTTSGDNFVPPTVTIGAGGSVTWQIAGNTHNVTFGALKPVGGDVPNTPSGGTATRVFANPGTYPYQCTLHSGMSGTVVVQGSGPPGVFTSLQMEPTATFVTVGGTSQLTATPLDGNGSTIPNLGQPQFQSSNTAIATVNATGLVTGVVNGTARITASLTSNGVTRSATSDVTVGVPTATVTTNGNQFNPETVEISVGGTVLWTFSALHNVMFEDLIPPGGHIPNSPAGSSAARTFTAVGDYDYECTLHSGMKGRIRVR
jgi:plastocyanin